MFGGLSSRFWMLRKYINNQNDKQFKKLPFYSWNCLTLFLKHREVDLVIKDEVDMENLIKFLICRLKTIDGNRGTALKVIDTMNAQSQQEA